MQSSCQTVSPWVQHAYTEVTVFAEVTGFSLSAGGVTALMHACAGSPAELQIALLTVLRQLVVQPTGPEAFLVARALPVLAMLQHSLVAEVRILSTKILERVAASSSSAEDAIAQEQLVQVCSPFAAPLATWQPLRCMPTSRTVQNPVLTRHADKHPITLGT